MTRGQARAMARTTYGAPTCGDAEPEVGVEPTTFRLRVECATTAPLGLGPACGLSGECSEGAPAPTNEFRAPPPSPLRAPPSARPWAPPSARPWAPPSEGSRPPPGWRPGAV